MAQVHLPDAGWHGMASLTPLEYYFDSAVRFTNMAWRLETLLFSWLRKYWKMASSAKSTDACGACDVQACRLYKMASQMRCVSSVVRVPYRGNTNASDATR